MMDLHHIYEFFRNALMTNQFAQGGFAIAVLSGVFLFGKRTLTAFKTWFLRKTTMKIEILGTDSAYGWCQLWLANSKFGKKTQTLMTRDDNNGSCTLVPGTGRHIFFYKRRLFFLWSIVEPMKSDGVLLGYQRSLVMHIIPGTRQVGEDFIREAEDHYNAKNKTMINVYTADPWGDNWRLSNVVRKRSMESVVLAENTKTHILGDVQEFKNSKDRYISLSIPWRRGYLLHGKPGNGKTSLALAVASEFDYALYVMQLSCISSDDKVRTMCEKLPENSVLLIEDIDCIKQFADRAKNEASSNVRGVSLSGMLNALDGVTSGEGRILMMTTNHPDTLDPALIRPGRTDCHVEISTPTPYQVITLFERFYGDKELGEEFSHGLDYDRLSMAQLQVFMLKHKTAQDALRYQEELMYEERPPQTDQVQGVRLDGVVTTPENCNQLA